jgi:hypothetical protein
MFDMFQLRGVARRQDAALETEFAGFLDSGFGLGDAADLSGQADFAEERFASRVLSRLLDAMAATMPRSTAGSSTVTPPATLTKMS